MTGVKFRSRAPVVHGLEVSVPQPPPESEPAPRRRGDKQRQAILQAVRELIVEQPFADLSVSAISDRAGVARSGFYFYFDSKYAALAQVFAEATEELEELTHYFAPRGAHETPAAFARRMVGSAAQVFAHNDPVMHACNVARNTDAEIRKIQDAQIATVVDQIVTIMRAEADAGTAHPITDDLPALIQTLGATTVMVLSADPTFLVGGEPQRAVHMLEKMWLYNLWGGNAPIE
ncbi:MAG: TetR/AcrR family transcriptional regulator [Mycobacterium sp.]